MFARAAELPTLGSPPDFASVDPDIQILLISCASYATAAGSGVGVACSRGHDLDAPCVSDSVSGQVHSAQTPMPLRQ